MIWQYIRSRLTAHAARDAADNAEMEARLDWAIAKAADGWKEWSHSPPDGDVRWVECARYDWSAARVIDVNVPRAHMNVAGLWWWPWTGPEIEGDVAEGEPTP
jgi:hypothetical protein